MLKTRTVVLLVLATVFISASAATAAAGWKVNGTMLYYNNDHVGIGTRHPDTRLSVVGKVRGAFNENENEYTEIGHGGGHGFINTRGDGDLKFRHNGQNLMSLDDEGDLDVSGGVTWGTQTSYVSVAAAAFRPIQDGYDFYNDGYELTNINNTSDIYLAPVQIPDGAVVTKVEFYYTDGSSEDGYCFLYRDNLDGSDATLSAIWTSGSTGVATSISDTSISNATIDNSQYAYFLRMKLADDDIIGYGVVIEYEFTQPY